MGAGCIGQESGSWPLGVCTEPWVLSVRQVRGGTCHLLLWLGLFGKSPDLAWFRALLCGASHTLNLSVTSCFPSSLAAHGCLLALKPDVDFALNGRSRHELGVGWLAEVAGSCGSEDCLDRGEGSGCTAVGGVKLEDKPWGFGVTGSQSDAAIYSVGKMGGNAGAMGMGRRRLWVPTGLPSGWVEEGRTGGTWCPGDTSTVDVLFLVSSRVVFAVSS